MAGGWTDPQPVSMTSGTRKHEMEAFFSPHGAFFFFSRYNEPDPVSDIYWVSSTVVGEVITTSG